MCVYLWTCYTAANNKQQLGALECGAKEVKDVMLPIAQVSSTLNLSLTVYDDLS